MADIAQLARTVDDAARKAKAIKQLSAKQPLSVADSYAVQSASIQRRIARGEKRVGIKMGFTSRAKMVQMGIDDMIRGRLTDGGKKSSLSPLGPMIRRHPLTAATRPCGLLSFDFTRTSCS